MGKEHVCRCGTDGEDAFAREGLELLQHGSVAFDRELLAHAQLEPLEVDVAPSEREQLAPAQSRHERESESGREAVSFDRGEERPCFVERPRELPGGPRSARGSGAGDRVPRDVATRHSFLERHRDDLAHEPRQRRAQPCRYAVAR